MATALHSSSVTRSQCWLLNTVMILLACFLCFSVPLFIRTRRSTSSKLSRPRVRPLMRPAKRTSATQIPMKTQNSGDEGGILSGSPPSRPNGGSSSILLVASVRPNARPSSLPRVPEAYRLSREFPLARSGYRYRGVYRLEALRQCSLRSASARSRH